MGCEPLRRRPSTCSAAHRRRGGDPRRRRDFARHIRMCGDISVLAHVRHLLAFCRRQRDAPGVRGAAMALFIRAHRTWIGGAKAVTDVRRGSYERRDTKEACLNEGDDAPAQTLGKLREVRQAIDGDDEPPRESLATPPRHRHLASKGPPAVSQSLGLYLEKNT